ncbi:MASE1 domain-containing protein, partial [Falsiroseomonas sp.]|uniref:MASE1 domain-containing protein n=1 Tax=Falsiroseomonas sp. TaxID=2870721 RepID=UPI00273265DB
MPHSAAFTRPALSASAGFASALVAGVLALSLLSLALSRLEGGIALVWLSNGFAVGLLVWLRHAPPAWLWLALGAALVVPRLLADEPLLRAALVSAFNLAEIALVVYGVRRYGRPLSEPAALLGNAGLAAAFSSAASLFTAVATSLGLGLIDQRPLGAWSTATAIFSAHLLGLVITAGLVAFAIGQRGRLFGRRGGRASFVLTWSALLGVLLLVLAQSTYPLLFLPFLPLAWMSFRHGVSGAVVGVLSIGVASGAASILQLGPFQLVGETHAFAHRLLPQVYVLAACMLALPLGLMMAERRRLLRSLRSSESQYRLLAEHTR